MFIKKSERKLQKSLLSLYYAPTLQSKSEPRVKLVWEERERGREPSFAFERSGSIRAKGAASESGHPKGRPLSGAGNRT